MLLILVATIDTSCLKSPKSSLKYAKFIFAYVKVRIHFLKYNLILLLNFSERIPENLSGQIPRLPQRYSSTRSENVTRLKTSEFEAQKFVPSFTQKT